MHCNKIFDREIGGSKFANKGHNDSWRTPMPGSELFLERLETAHYDRIDISRYSSGGLPLSCQFGREKDHSHLCAVTDEDGHVHIFDTRPSVMARDAQRVKGWQGHGNAAFDFAWINGDTQCLTTSGDQTVVLWDVESASRVTTFRGHDCSVRTVAPHPTSPAQCTSGARDGHIMLWDTRVNRKSFDDPQQNRDMCINEPYKVIKHAHSYASRVDRKKYRRNNRHIGPKAVLDTQQSVTCVLYQKDNLLISAGAMDGCVKFWDTRKWYSNSVNSLPTPVDTFEYPGQSQRLKGSGIVTMCMDPWKSQLFVSYTDNKVYRFDIAGAQTKAAEYLYAGHRNDTFYVRCVVSPDGNYLLSGSGKNTGVIWQVDKPQRQPVFLIGHTQDVSSVDWCPTDMSKLATLSDDQSLRIWRPDQRERCTEDPSIVGFAYTARKGKTCTRQARVHIIQDEFPFRPFVEVTEPSRTPVQGASPSASAESADKCLPAGQSQAKSKRQLFCTLRAAHSRLLLKSSDDSSLAASTSQQSLRALKEQVTPPLKRRPEVVGLDDSDSENGGLTPRQSPHHRQFVTPQQRRMNSSLSSSPSTPENSLMLLPFSSYRLTTTIRRHSESSESDFETEAPPAERPCLRNIDTNSPSKRGSGSKLRAIPKKSPAKSPVKSPNKRVVKAQVLVFSSPTANLPNSVLNPPQKRSPAPPSDAEKKVDWLTKYRLAKAETSNSSTKGAVPKSSPLSANRKLFRSEASSISDKDSGKGTPKRKSSSLDDLTPSKRTKTEENPATPKSSTPKSLGRRNSCSKSGTNSTPNRRVSTSTNTPQSAPNMSIRRYLWWKGVTQPTNDL